MQKTLKVVSVDDSEMNLLLIEAMFHDIDVDVISILNPLEAITYIEKNGADLILVDYMMPEMHGVDFIKRVRTFCSDTPIIMITSILDDNVLKLNAIEAGATEFLNKPLNRAEFKARVTNMVSLRKAQLLLKDRALLLEQEVEKAVCTIRDREHEALSVLGRAAEYKDPETGAHIARVAHYSRLIAEKLGETAENCDLIFYAAPLHDVGKMGIPDSILNKKGPFTAEEFELMKTHTSKGFDMLKDSRSQYLKAGGVIAVSHHERFDGTGYPYGLTGDDIPSFGRMVAVADVFDAVMSKRPYKDPWSMDKALELISDQRGKHFDPDMADAFLRSTDEVKKIYETY